VGGHYFRHPSKVHTATSKITLPIIYLDLENILFIYLFIYLFLANVVILDNIAIFEKKNLACGVFIPKNVHFLIQMFFQKKHENQTQNL
jgi:positive regulator of sigma E activity